MCRILFLTAVSCKFVLMKLFVQQAKLSFKNTPESSYNRQQPANTTLNVNPFVKAKKVA